MSENNRFDLMRAIQDVKPVRSHRRLAPVQECHAFVGVLSDTCRRTLQLACDVSDEADRIDKEILRIKGDRLESHANHTLHACANYTRSLTELQAERDEKKNQFDSLNKIIWALVDLEFPQLQDEIKGICEDGQLVIQKKREESGEGTAKGTEVRLPTPSKELYQAMFDPSLRRN